MSRSGIVLVWDLPTRIFHWGLLGLVAVAWATGGEEGSAFTLHRLAGEAIAGLIVFRIVWGFVGGERARFSDFAAGPGRVIAHVRDLFSPAPKRHLGHNPLGGVAVFLLLGTVAAIVATGLLSSGEEASGPLAGLVRFDAAEVHEALFRVLQALVVLHVLGVVLESALTKDGLIPAMISGTKRRRPDEPGEDAQRAGPAAAIAAVALGVVTTGGLAALPPGKAMAAEAKGEMTHRERDEVNERGADD